MAGLRPIFLRPFAKKGKGGTLKMKRLMLLCVAVLALASVGIAASVATAGGNGAVVLTMANTPVPAFQLVGANYNFNFLDGNGAAVVVAPTYYQEVLAPSGVNTEVLKGTVANDSGQAVIYTADSGPYAAGATCWDFATGNTSPDWQMTISAAGNFTLTCHFDA
jgi:hypothetical protein